jgi:hypothetical protein
MRTKTLLLTTVLGVASIVAAVAQTTPVYSVNAVGYINVTVPPGYSLIANQLKAASSKVSDLLTGVPGGTKIFKFDNAKNAYVVNGYDSDFQAWDSTTMTLDPGEGAFIFNPSKTASFNVTFVGEVPQGDVSINIPAGYSIISSKVPQAGGLDTLGYVPAASDAIFRFDNAKNAYSVYRYDADFQAWDPGTPSVNVGESFFILKAAAGKWTRTFTVN